MNRPTASRLAKLAAVAALGTLSLAACGSDPVATNGSEPGGSTSSSSSNLACPAGSLTAEGSTAQGNAIAEIISAYGSACSDKATIEYNGTGSGAGIKSFYNGLVDFAGSDSALKSEEKDGVVETDKAKQRCQGNEAWNIPMVVGPIAVAYNVDGVDKLVLTPEVLSGIFNGTIKTWDDPKIAALNDGVTLPKANITVFFRSDESGTTENFTKFLSGAGKGAWKQEPGKKWTGTGEGKNKSSGVAQGVTSTKNSISYMEWSYARDNKLKTAQIDNGAGPVELTGEAVAEAVAEAKVKGTGNDLALDIKYADTAKGAYPALLVTYEIVCSKGLDAGKTALVKDFLGFFASSESQKSLEEIGYAPLPAQLQTKVTASIAAIQ
ncbi:phosphate transport system substrate-binding protein [Microlunatus panaciterrae]|uniref:Phosphate-binding protein n=1 Tax=Microlunatus panaciterrae TaxID=400768 RepID=A0ABS2RI30_9ACTN|nr:phosphate ABC transporter substrate-binding protein PstS [Microlunatus panaciterrae]MBM7798348.1 phosphate transport system substrate-binding protein [Microlunatus panaciterrae]